MFKTVVGHGIDPDSAGAIQEAMAQCQEALGNDIPQAGILIAAIDFDHETILQDIRKIYPDILIIGGTSVGEMSSAMGFQEDSLTLMLFCSDEVTFKVGAGKSVSEDALAASKMAIAQASPATPPEPDGPESLKLCYVLAEGLLTNATALVEGLRTATENKTPIIGGLTADDWQFKTCYQFISTSEKTEVLRDALVVLTFAGNLKMSYSIEAGKRPIGPKAVVTKSEGNTIYEIDGQPAKDFYTQSFGMEELMLTGGGSLVGSLAIREPNCTDFYVRSPNGNGHPDGSVSYFGHIPEQSIIQLLETDNETLLTSAKKAVQTALTTYPGKSPAAALIVSCASRLKTMGTRTEQEYALAEECLTHGTPIMGFHAFGEISPFATQTVSHFHNETFIALLLGTC
ncbi:MAG: FIST N-terminal domain-containing protein [Cyanobacteria bacterium P01_D01_bin.105]